MRLEQGILTNHDDRRRCGWRFRGVPGPGGRPELDRIVVSAAYRARWAASRFGRSLCYLRWHDRAGRHGWHIHWSLPAGRPEGDETWEQTLRREVQEEACATVTESKLLGFCRSFCVEGREKGLALVRSFWRAQVELERWEPRFEISHRRVFPPAEVLPHLAPEYSRIFRRSLMEALGCLLMTREGGSLVEAE